MRTMLRRLIATGVTLLTVAGCTPGDPPSDPSSPAPTTPTASPEDTRPPIEQIIDVPFRMDHSVLPDGVTESPTWGSVTLNGDGTVVGDECLTFISNPTHWRRDGDILKFCTSEDCEFWSEWTVRKPEQEEGKPAVFELVFANAKDDQGNEIIRILRAKQ
ncbi:MAG: hypothetical protein Q4D89_09100 [Arachnia propionica]|uniref:hypothetical protein n=1 Tax=Arachnia propionica TaxID=1750 RepID=UPI0026FB68D8|nr:hypothetical protein [Arachnia propionica]